MSCDKLSQQGCIQCCAYNSRAASQHSWEDAEVSKKVGHLRNRKKNIGLVQRPDANAARVTHACETNRRIRFNTKIIYAPHLRGVCRNMCKAAGTAIQPDRMWLSTVMNAECSYKDVIFRCDRRPSTSHKNSGRQHMWDLQNVEASTI